MTEVDPRSLQELVDRQAILDAVLRYCRGVDRCDAELTESAYFPDAVDDHGLFVGDPHAFAELVNRTHQRTWASTMHVVANHYVEFEGDGRVARGETYVVAYLRRLDGSAVDAAGGRYVDRFERRGGEWRIAHRLFVWEWSSALDPESLIEGKSFSQGVRTHDDPGYFGAAAGGG